MIDILTNGFLTSPAAVQFTGNYCSHGCVYCFANINSPKRTLDIKAVTSQLRNYKNRDDLVSFYLREKYPLLISNNIDPFSKSNQPFVNTLIRTLNDLDIPIVFATRGGYGIEDVFSEIKKSVWYVSIPYGSDEMRKKYEPNAPAIELRWELVQRLKESNHEVILSINPLNKVFCENEPTAIAERAKNLGVRSLLINRLHLSPKQQANLTDREKQIIGEKELSNARQRTFTDDLINLAIELHEYCIENDLNLVGFDSGLFNRNLLEFQDCYEKFLPIDCDFFRYLYLYAEDNSVITFETFYNFFAPLLPNIEGNISKYIFNRGVISDTSFYKKMTLKNLLHLYWENDKVGLNLPKNYPAFSWLKVQTNNKLDFAYDDDHNKVMVYHKNPEFFNTKEYTIYKI